jgi:hypothetical protein
MVCIIVKCRAKLGPLLTPPLHLFECFSSRLFYHVLVFLFDSTNRRRRHDEIYCTGIDFKDMHAITLQRYGS